MAMLGKNFPLPALWLCSMLATSSQQIQCDNQNQNDGYLIDDTGRAMILEIHNQKRMATANAEYRNGKNTFNIRYAKNMMEMKYDCALEASAHSIVSTCPETETPQTSLTTEGENFAKIDKEYEEIGSASQAMYIAGTRWFEEITKNGINQNIDFTQFFANKKPTVYHWSQMVWAKTWKVGCEIGNCNGFTIVVCRYSPKGNVLGQKVYQPGQVLACDHGKSQGYDKLCAYE